MKRRLRNRKSIRAQWWDYGFAGWYSVTIRVHFSEGDRNVFGHIDNEKMILNETGRIVDEEWLKSAGIRQDMKITLDEYQVMPDYFHGIMHIGQNEFNHKKCADNDQEQFDHVVSSVRAHVSTQGEKKSLNKFGPQSKNLSITLNQFKGAVTRRARATGRPIEWQGRFHDRIIRSHEELERLRQYIRDNPKKWGGDTKDGLL